MREAEASSVSLPQGSGRRDGFTHTDSPPVIIRALKLLHSWFGSYLRPQGNNGTGMNEARNRNREEGGAASTRTYTAHTYTCGQTRGLPTQLQNSQRVELDLASGDSLDQLASVILNWVIKVHQSCLPRPDASHNHNIVLRSGGQPGRGNEQVKTVKLGTGSLSGCESGSEPASSAETASSRTITSGLSAEHAHPRRADADHRARSGNDA